MQGWPLHFNIYELRLIYDIKVDPSGTVGIKMTLTAPNCPAALSLPIEVESKVGSIPGATDANVEVVWDPPWDPSRMSEAAKLGNSACSKPQPWHECLVTTTAAGSDA